MPKNVCFAAFQYFLSKFHVNISGDLKLWGGCVCGEKSSTRYLCVLFPVLRVLVQFQIDLFKYAVWEGELTWFFFFYPNTDLSLKKSLRLGSGIMPWCFKEYSF